MATTGLIAFAPNGEYLAYSSPDGTLKIWDTATGTTKHEYTPSSHLSSTCTCLSWGPVRRYSPETPRKKKRRSRQAEMVEGVDLIALGTASGSVLLYSMVTGDLQTQLDGGHNEPVNGICWHSEENALYSCSNDQHIVEWDLSKGKVKHKWKADTGSVHSICLCPGENALLSAGRTIKLWDLHTHQVLKTFTGHATEVIRLLCVQQSFEQNGAAGEDPLETIHNTYFLSAALNDRLINAWQIQKSSKNKNSLAVFSLPDEPVAMNISKMSQREDPLLLGVVTKNGQLVIFEHVLNGKCKKPLKPKVSVQIATSCSEGEVPRPIPLLATHFTNQREQQILICHGNFLKPVFEKIPYNSDEPNVCLIREDPTKMVLRQETEVSKVKTPATSGDVTVLTPGVMAPSAPALSSETSGKRKSKRKSSVNEMSMEDRLHAISIEKNTEQKSVTQPPKADTLATLLAQGLQSKDKKILNNVLQNTNEDIIRNTVRRLPVPVVIPLVHELSQRMHGHSQIGHTLVKWIKMVLTMHTSYLMTFPELVDTLSTLYRMMDARVAVLGRLSRLQGKLDLMLSQITSQTPDEDDSPVQQTAMLIYQDESSDEEELMDDIVPGQSESEDWEDLSEAEDEDKEDEDEDEDEDMSSHHSDSPDEDGGTE